MRIRRSKYSRLWVLLLYLALVTSLILSVTLARYSSSAGGTGTATVAAVAGGGGWVESTPIEMPLENMAPGEKRELKFQVVNFSGGRTSEVAMDYQITVEVTRNLPLVFTLTPDEAGNRVSGGKILTTGTKQTLEGGAFPLTGEKQTHTYTLTVEWVDRYKTAALAYEIDLVTVKVRAVQKLAP